MGTLVTAATFRWPGPSRSGVAQVDQMRGGRVEPASAPAGTRRSTGYGIPFPSLRERFGGSRSSCRSSPAVAHRGRTFPSRERTTRSTTVPALPKPLQPPHPPIIVGGAVRPDAAVAADLATEFNMPFAAPRPSSTASPTSTRPVGDRPATVPGSSPPGLSSVSRSVFRPLSSRASSTSSTGFPTYAARGTRTVSGCSLPPSFFAASCSHWRAHSAGRPPRPARAGPRPPGASGNGPWLWCQ